MQFTTSVDVRVGVAQGSGAIIYLFPQIEPITLCA